jgi:hypothetical protein
MTEPKLKRLRDVYPVTLPDKQVETAEKVRFGHYTPEYRKTILTKHRQAKSRERAEASEKLFLIDGEPACRTEIMIYLVAMVAAGESLQSLCAHEGMPTTLEVRHWRQWHRDFDKDLKEADLERGAILGEESLKTPLEADDDCNAALVKLKTETLAKAAARLNSDFQEKKLVQTEDISDHATYDQLVDRWKRLVKDHPALKELGNSVGISEAEIVTEEANDNP